MPQGLYTYPGIVQPVACRYTRSHGVMPGHAILEYNPQGTNIASGGLLQISYDGLTVNIPNCRLDFTTLRGDAETGWIAVAKVWDRRWAWQAGGEIGGRYNIRFPFSGNLDTTTEKTPQELAALLLDAMGEVGYDVSALPNTTRPYANWDYAHPATELERLCDELGCRVVLEIDTDIVKIVVPGAGVAPPVDGDTYSYAYAADQEEAPDKIKVAGSVVRFQSKLLLVAVGKDTDGEVKPINDLSYNPDPLGANWAGIDRDFAAILDDDERNLAIETVFSWYQVVSQSDGTQDVPGYGDIGKIRNLLPIDGRSLNTYNVDVISGREVADEAFIEGQWYDTQTQFAFNTEEFVLFNGNWTLDVETGIVKFFNEKLYLMDGVAKAPATLYLTCAYFIEHPTSRQLVTFELERDLGGTNGTGPFVTRRPDIKRIITANYILPNAEIVASVDDNLIDVNIEANAHLDAIEASFINAEAKDIKYNGLKQIELTGLVRQVTYVTNSLDESPRGGMETYVSINSETDPYVERSYSRRAKRDARRSRQELRQDRPNGRPPIP